MRRSWPGVFAAALALLVAGTAAAPAQAANQWSSGLGPCIQPSGGLSSLDGDVIVQVDRTTCINSTDASLLWNTPFVRTSGGFFWYHFVNSGTGRCLDLTDGITADGTPLQQWTCNDTSDTMLWRFASDDNGKTRIVNKRSGKCMDVRGGSAAPGTVIQNYHCASFTFGQPNLAQQWFQGPR